MSFHVCQLFWNPALWLGSAENSPHTPSVTSLAHFCPIMRVFAWDSFYLFTLWLPSLPITNIFLFLNCWHWPTPWRSFLWSDIMYISPCCSGFTDMFFFTSLTLLQDQELLETLIQIVNPAPSIALVLVNTHWI